MRRFLSLFISIALSLGLFLICGCVSLGAEKSLSRSPLLKNDAESAPTADVTTGKNRVIFLAGGINCAGYSPAYKLRDTDNSTNVTSEKYAEYERGYDNVKIAYKIASGRNTVNRVSNGFVTATIGQGFLHHVSTPGGRIGPELGLAEYMSFNYPLDTTYIVKYAATDGSFRHGMCVGGDYYEQMIAFFDESLSLVEGDYEIDGMCFVHGEGDASFGKKAYLDALTEFASAIKSRYGARAGEGFSFTDVAVPQYYIGYGAVNEAKRTYAESDDKNYYIDARACGLTYNRDDLDRKHFDAISEIKLGNLMGYYVKDALKTPINPATIKLGATAPTSEELEENGVRLSCVADGSSANSYWNFSVAGDTLTVKATVFDEYVTASDAVEVIVAKKERANSYSAETLKMTVTADGNALFGRFNGVGFVRSDFGSSDIIYKYDGGKARGYEIEATIKTGFNSEELSLAFSLTNANVHAQKAVYSELGAKEDKPYSFMTLSGGELVKSEYPQYGLTMGDASNLKASAVWDLSRDDGTESAQVAMSGVNGIANELYMYESRSPRLKMEVNVGASGVYNGEVYGKFGIKVATLNDKGVFFYVDAYGYSNVMTGCGFGYAVFDGYETYGWTSCEYTIPSANMYQKGNTLKLAVVRDRTDYYFYCNDALVVTVRDPAGIGAAEAYMGLNSFNIAMYANSYKLYYGDDFSV